jgi:hypothetical protein
MSDFDESRNYRGVFRGEFRRRRPKGLRARESTIEDWYGEEMGSLEAEAKQPAVRDLASLVDDIRSDMEQDDLVLLRTIIERWPELVDAKTAAQAVPRRIEGQVLHVEVFNAAFRYHIQSFGVKQRLAEAVKELSGGRVNDVRLVVGGATMR